MKKVFTVNNIFALSTCVLSILVLILYLINFNVNGYFQGVIAKGVVLFTILVILFDVLIVAKEFLKLDGIVATIVDILGIILKILVPVFLMIATLSLVQSRIEGFGYIFGSNVDVQKEVATPANLASAGVSIAAIAIALIGSIAGIVGAFFLPKKD